MAIHAAERYSHEDGLRHLGVIHHRITSCASISRAISHPWGASEARDARIEPQRLESYGSNRGTTASQMVMSVPMAFSNTNDGCASRPSNANTAARRPSSRMDLGSPSKWAENLRNDLHALPDVRANIGSDKFLTMAVSITSSPAPPRPSPGPLAAQAAYSASIGPLALANHRARAPART